MMIPQQFIPVVADTVPSDNVQIEADTSFEDNVRLLVTTKHILEGTVTVRSVLDNATSSQPMPASFVIKKPYTRFEVLRFTRKDANSPWHFNWHYNFKNGLPSSKTTVDYEYSLPYNGQHEITQSYLGSHSHFRGSETEYAVDIEMPEGTKVLAARPGVVIAFRDDSNKGGNSPDFKDDANDVVISHGDGTYADYVHLKFNGVLVKLGQHVALHQAIGLSGSTGWSTRPHLHFGLFRVISGEKLESLPFKMQTPRGVVKQLETGQSY